MIDMKKEIEKLYIKLQKESGFKIGDTVKVVNSANDYENGWNHVWISDMENSIGNEFKVISIEGNEGIRLSFGCIYPFFVLEKVNTKVNTKVNVKTYHVSQRFLHNSNEYLLASVGNNRVNLINIETGCRLSVHGLIVNDTRKITEKEIIELVDEYYSMWNEFVMVE